MDLVAATREFESKFDTVESTKLTDTSHLDVVCSGGTCAENAPVPILYLEKEQAVKDWLTTATEKAGTAKVLKWVTKPELVKFQITMADNKRGHRVVSDRYAVRSKFIAEGGNG